MTKERERGGGREREREREGKAERQREIDMGKDGKVPNTNSSDRPEDNSIERLQWRTLFVQFSVKKRPI